MKNLKSCQCPAFKDFKGNINLQLEKEFRNELSTQIKCDGNNDENDDKNNKDRIN